MITKEELIKKYNLTLDDFIEAKISWDDLVFIYNDYNQKKDTIYSSVLNDFLTKYILDTKKAKIHSYRSRLKDPEHLIVKIIRKKSASYKKYKDLNKDNYENFITDLIGFRVFILFKEDWIGFHNYITTEIVNDPSLYIKKWNTECKNDDCFIEPPKVHIRSGDSDTIYKGKIPDANIHTDKIYRSIHYTIRYHSVNLEIQLRTLYEESWGEIDHHIVYPYYTDDKILSEFSSLLNRLSGLADEMGSYFEKVKNMEEKLLKFQNDNKVCQVITNNESKEPDKISNVGNTENTDTINKKNPQTPANILHEIILT